MIVLRIEAECTTRRFAISLLNVKRRASGSPELMPYVILSCLQSYEEEEHRLMVMRKTLAVG